jgi:hypothetical protein
METRRLFVLPATFWVQASCVAQVYVWRYAIAKRNLSASGLASKLLDGHYDTGLLVALGLAATTLHRKGLRQ